MSHSADKLSAIVATYNGRIVMPKSLLERYLRELPDGGKQIGMETVMRAMRSSPFVEVVKTHKQGSCSTLIGYRSIRHYQHPLSHAYDALATMTGKQVWALAIVVVGILGLAILGAIDLLKGGI